MEYHSYKFQDHSLLFFDEKELIAIMPCNVKDNVLYSHGGLTFGGLTINENIKTNYFLVIFSMLVEYAKKMSFLKIIYKPIPYIFHRYPANEDLYALFIHKARLIKRDVSSVIEMGKKIPYNKRTKRNIAKAKEANLQIIKNDKFSRYIDLVATILAEKYSTTPTHSIDEINLLASRFPENIKLFNVEQGSEFCGGIIIYESDQVAHLQYIAFNELGQNNGAMDFLVNYLIQEYAQKKFMSFGISTSQPDCQLNAGLIEKKEGFGARAIMHDVYEINLV